MKWSCQGSASTKKMGLFGGAAGVAHPQHVACHVRSCLAGFMEQMLCHVVT